MPECYFSILHWQCSRDNWVKGCAPVWNGVNACMWNSKEKISVWTDSRQRCELSQGSLWHAIFAAKLCSAMGNCYGKNQLGIYFYRTSSFFFAQPTQLLFKRPQLSFLLNPVGVLWKKVGYFGKLNWFSALLNQVCPSWIMWLYYPAKEHVVLPMWGSILWIKLSYSLIARARVQKIFWQQTRKSRYMYKQTLKLIALLISTWAVRHFSQLHYHAKMCENQKYVSHVVQG